MTDVAMASGFPTGDSEQVLVSVVIPAYNAGAFLARTLDSVLAQTHENWEIVAVDDGSTDDTAEILERYAQRDPRIRWLSQANEGVSVARNRGVRESNGDFVAFLDADDVFVPCNLERKLHVLKTRPEIGWVYSDMSCIDLEDRPLPKPERGTGRDVLNRLLMWSGEVVPAPPSNIVLRSRCLAAIGGFDPDLSTAADQDFCIRLAAHYRCVHLEEELLAYRVWSGSMSRNVELMESDHLRVYRKARSAGLFPTKQFERACFSSLYWILAGSWWKNGKNRLRALRFISLAIKTRPASLASRLGRFVSNRWRVVPSSPRSA